MRICIDPGHTFGSNPSPADPTYSEGTRMFALARFLRRALERYGAEVVCTRGRVIVAMFYAPPMKSNDRPPSAACRIR